MENSARAACTRLTPLDLLPWVLAGSGRRLVISRLIASTLCLAYSSLLRRCSPVLRRTSLARASFFSFRSLPLGRRPSRSRRCSSSPSAAGLVFFCSFRFVVARLARAGALPRLLARALAFFLFFFRLVVARLARAGALPRLLARALAFVFSFRLVVARLARFGGRACPGHTLSDWALIWRPCFVKLRRLSGLQGP